MSAHGGGPAFPTSVSISDDGIGFLGEPVKAGSVAQYCGMSLRDYFAAKAMQGFIANKARPTTFHSDDDAKYCYTLADAMLAAREAKP